MRAWIGAVVIILAGCSSGPGPAAPFVRRSAAYVRFLNLSDRSLEASVGKQSRIASIEPGSMTEGSIISLSKQAFRLTSDMADAQIEATPTPGKYLTVVAAGSGNNLKLSTVVGSNCLTPSKSSRIEVSNFTAQTVTCSLEGKDYKLGPGESQAVDVTPGRYIVTSPEAKSQTLTTKLKEIWLVYFTSAGSKVVSSSIPVKKPMQPTANGASAAG